MLEFSPHVLVRELFNGDFVACPVAAPSLIAYAESEDDALLELEVFLREHLASEPASSLARYVLPDGANLLDVELFVPRDDLPRPLQPTSPLAISCVVIPESRASWVYVIPLAHTFYLDPDEELAPAVEREVTRLVSAREMTPVEYLTLFPARRQRLDRLPLQIDRLERRAAGQVARKRAKLASKKQKHESRLLLLEVGKPLTRDARRCPELIGRARERDSLLALLDASSPMCVAIVGPTRSGKTALLDSLVISKALGREVFATSGAQLVAGQSGFGQWQDRLHRVMRAAEELDAILYFDDFSDLFSGQAGGMLDMASVMRPYVESGRVRIVGELTPENLDQYERRYVSFFANLHRVRVDEMTPHETEAVLRAHIKFSLERYPGKAVLAADAVTPLVELAGRYMPYRAFPGKAVALYEDLRAMHESDYIPDGEQPRIEQSAVYDAFSVRTGIPVFLLREDSALKRDEILEYFSRRVIGQEDAVRRVADVVCAVKARLQPPGKPLATLLFVGPTGVGKTEVAKTLARFLFGAAERMIRFDMSEYMDVGAVARLIQGTERGEGELTRKIRQQPFSVLLLDEIEKAHPAVFDLLLQVCGEGRLTDARGKTAHFHNTLIIMTSNLGAAHRRDALGFGEVSALDDSEHYMEQVTRKFRPEFVNRLDAVVGFHALTRAQAGAVAAVVLERILERPGLAEAKVAVDVSSTALELLATRGYSEAYGARALRRYLDTHLARPIAHIASKYADQLRAGFVVVRALEGEPEEEDLELMEALEGRGVIVERETALLSFVVYRAGNGGARTMRGMDAIAHFRRRASRSLRMDRVTQVKEHMDFLLAQMNSGGKKKRKRLEEDPRFRKEQAALQAEYTRLEHLWTALQVPMSELLAVEELAIGALFDGEPLKPLIEEAEQLWNLFASKLIYVLLAQVQKRDEITFLIRRISGVTAPSVWLENFFKAAEERSWAVRLHIDGDRYDAAVPNEHERWGAARTPEFWGQKAAAHVDDWRNVLVSVRGKFAGALLVLEMGRHIYHEAREGTVDNNAEFILSPCLDTFTITPEQFTKERALQLTALPPDRFGGVKPVRRWLLDEGKVGFGRRELARTRENYWEEGRYEALVLELLLERYNAGGAR